MRISGFRSRASRDEWVTSSRTGPCVTALQARKKGKVVIVLGATGWREIVTEILSKHQLEVEKTTHVVERMQAAADGDFVSD